MHDDFVNAVTLFDGATAALTGTAASFNFGSTRQSGEATTGSSVAQENTVWFVWKAPSTLGAPQTFALLFETSLPQSTHGFNTVLDVFHKAGDVSTTDITELVAIGGNDDCDGDLAVTTSCLALNGFTVPASADITLYIRVAGTALGEDGTFALSWYLGTFSKAAFRFHASPSMFMLIPLTA